MSDSPIEIMARAIDSLSEYDSKSYLEEARLAVHALEAAGYRIVPVASTEFMQSQGKTALWQHDNLSHWGYKYVCAKVYEEMVAAAPEVK